MRAHPLFCLLFAYLFCSMTIADTVVSHHTTQTKAEQKIRDLMWDEGCAKTETTTKNDFRVIEDDTGNYWMYGNDVLYSCTVMKATVNNNTISISWKAPSSREDGENLDLSEIKNYTITENGSVIGVTTDTHIVLNGVTPGDHIYGLQTVDVYNTKSDIVYTTKVTIN